MGLDVEFFEHARRLDPQPEEAFEDAMWLRDDAVKAFAYDDHQHSFRGLERGWYVVSGRSGHFAAGSCTGYGEWRRRLCLCALDVEPEVVWEHPDRFREEPFYEIIHFADNEGCIGPEAAADLAHDFGANQRRVLRTYRASWAGPPIPAESFSTLYAAFKRAFNVAAGDGLVRFR